MGPDSVRRSWPRRSRCNHQSFILEGPFSGGRRCWAGPGTEKSANELQPAPLQRGLSERWRRVCICATRPSPCFSNRENVRAGDWNLPPREPVRAVTKRMTHSWSGCWDLFPRRQTEEGLLLATPRPLLPPSTFRSLSVSKLRKRLSYMAPLKIKELLRLCHIRISPQQPFFSVGKSGFPRWRSSGAVNPRRA